MKIAGIIITTSKKAEKLSIMLSIEKKNFLSLNKNDDYS